MAKQPGIKPSPWATLRDLGLSALLSRGGAPSEKDSKAAEDAATYAEAGVYYRRLAAQGDPNAQYDLAVMYDFGRDVRRDPARALRLYRLAADAGHVEAMFMLGASYHQGDGAPVDLRAAIAWYRKAADAGEVRAQNNLAVLLRDDETGGRDLEAARRYFRMAAEAGNANAQFNLAAMFADGKGGERDLAATAEWYGKAARKHHVDAMFALADMCFAGEADGLTFKTGLGMLARAALRDHSDAMVLMSALYLTGEHVPQDVGKAFGWAALALAAHLEDPAVDVEAMASNLENLRARMSEEDLDRGRRYVLRRRGVNELLVMANVYQRRLGVDIPVGEIDEAESERWIELAMEHGSGTRRYLGMVRHGSPEPPWPGRKMYRRLVGKRIFTEST